MDWQTAFDVAMALAGFMGGWILTSIKDSMEALRLREEALMNKVQHIEVLVAGSYVRREDLEKIAKSLFDKLDTIEEKLHQHRVRD
jgi:hypothetical protein